MPITNHDVLSAYNHSAALRYKYRHVSQRLVELSKTLEELKEMLAVLDKVSDIHEGIALEIVDNAVISVVTPSVWAKVIDDDGTFTVVGWIDGTSHDVATAFRSEDALARAKEFVSAHSPID
jgi:hypothetical protein